MITFLEGKLVEAATARREAARLIALHRAAATAPAATTTASDARESASRDAIAVLTHQSHRWAVAQLLK